MGSLYDPLVQEDVGVPGDDGELVVVVEDLD